jgi:tRNA dimethylallyltransferase
VKVRALCVLGATGTGKTEAALILARAFGGEVVNFDSRQVYRDVPITTAQPSMAEQGVCPHHLYGFLPLAERVCAGAFAGTAARVMQDITARGALPILVGGTGLYLRAILEGLAPIPDVPDGVREKVFADWDELGGEDMHARLAAIDPEYARKIHSNDRQRVTRALEVFEATGRTFTHWHAATARPLDVACLKMGLAIPKPALDARLAARVGLMLEAGALGEIREALRICPDPAAPGLTGIGCAELAAHLRGELTLDAARALWLTSTKAYAKRQATWFKKEPDVAWYAPGEAPAMAEAARRWLGDARP